MLKACEANNLAKEIKRVKIAHAEAIDPSLLAAVPTYADGCLRSIERTVEIHAKQGDRRCDWRIAYKRKPEEDWLFILKTAENLKASLESCGYSFSYDMNKLVRFCKSESNWLYQETELTVEITW